MSITVKIQADPRETVFEKIKMGDTFIYRGQCYLKTSTWSVNLENGVCSDFNCYTGVVRKNFILTEE